MDNSYRYGNTGSRFRGNIFGLTLRGPIGSKIIAGIKYGGPLAGATGIVFSLASDQPNGYKIVDTGSGLASIFGGSYGILGAALWNISIKPLHRAVVYPTPAEDRARWHNHVEYCNSSSKCN